MAPAFNIAGETDEVLFLVHKLKKDMIILSFNNKYIKDNFT